MRAQGRGRRHRPREPALAGRGRRPPHRRGARRRRSPLRRRLHLRPRSTVEHGASPRIQLRSARDDATASSSSTSPRAGRRTTSSPGCASSTASGGSGTRARSIPTPRACCSSASDGSTRLLRFLQEAGKEYRGRRRVRRRDDTLDAAGRRARPRADAADARAGRAAPRRVRRRHRADAADGVGDQGRRPAPPRARARGRGGRARAAAGSHRHARVEDVRARAVPVGRRSASSARSGTYVRSLAADLGTALGGCAHLESLRRLRVGSFGLDEAHTLDAIEADPERCVLAPVDAVRDLERVAVDAEQARAVAHGATFAARCARGRRATGRSRSSTPTVTCSRCTSAVAPA